MSKPIWEQYGFPSEKEFRKRYPLRKKSEAITLSDILGGEPKEMSHDKFARLNRVSTELEFYNSLNPEFQRVLEKPGGE